MKFINFKRMVIVSLSYIFVAAVMAIIVFSAMPQSTQ